MTVFPARTATPRPVEGEQGPARIPVPIKTDEANAAHWLGERLDLLRQLEVVLGDAALGVR
jgi:hypothetical protein